MEIIFQLDKTTECNPENRRGLSFEINYDPEATQQQVALSNNRWRFAREDRDYIIKNARAFIGMKFDLLLKQNGKPEQLLENYLDFSQDFLKSRNECVATSVRYNSMYWFNDASSAITYEYLFNNNTTQGLPSGYASWHDWFLAKQIYVPYVISSLPKTAQAFQAIITGVYIVMAIKECLKTIAQMTADSVGGFTTIPGILKLALELVYLILLIIALVLFITQFLLCIIQPVKYTCGMYYRDLMFALCSYLGMKFVSSIFTDTSSAWYNKIYLPEKYQPFENPKSLLGFAMTVIGLYGYTQPTPAGTNSTNGQKGFFNGTPFEFFNVVKKEINGKIVIKPDAAGVLTLYLERKDWSNSNVKWQMPAIRNDWTGYNTNDFFATTILTYQYDLSDNNTVDQWQGTNLQITQTNASCPDPFLNLAKKAQTITFEVALAKRKETLSAAETIIQGIMNFLSTFGAVAWDFHRIGMLLLEDDMYSVPKTFIGVEYAEDGFRKAKIDPNNRAVVSAKYVHDRFYCINNFVPNANNEHGQYLLFKPALTHESDENKTPLDYDGYTLLENDNKFNDSNGNECELISAKWVPDPGYLDGLYYRIKHIYEKDLVLTLTEPTGN